MAKAVEHKFIKVIDHFTRERSSVNGNPRFTVHFTDGTSFKTSPDAMFAYGIENRENLTPDGVEITVDGRGNIIYLTPVKKEGE